MAGIPPRLLKFGKKYLYALTAGFLIGISLALRLVFIALGWPHTDSDESTMGLMALHIFQGRDFPIFFYGQHYMGSIEAYIGAMLFFLFGPSLFALRLGLLLLFACFLVTMYFLTKTLYSRGFALLVLLFLIPGSTYIFWHQLGAIGGYPELELMSALLVLLTFQLAFTLHSHQRKLSPRRALAYLLWGLLAGLGIWSQQVILPILGMAGLFLVFACRREIFWRSWWCLLLGLVIGGLPLILYNVTAKPGSDTISILLSTMGVQGKGHAQYSYYSRLFGTIFDALPAATGGQTACQVVSLRGLLQPSCLATQGIWAVGYILLFACAFLMCVLDLWKLHRLSHPVSTQPLDKEGIHQAQLRQWGRITLLLCVPPLLLAFSLSPLAFEVPLTSSRYLICLFIVLPAVLWPLWLSGQRQHLTRRFRDYGMTVLRLGLLALVFLTLAFGTIQVFQDVPRAQAMSDDTEEIIQTLLSHQKTTFYTDYWICHRVVFASQERLQCATIQDDLTYYANRYPAYRANVEAASHPAYLLYADSAAAKNLIQLLKTTHISYRSITFGKARKYILFLPEKQPSLPVPVTR